MKKETKITLTIISVFILLLFAYFIFNSGYGRGDVFYYKGRSYREGISGTMTKELTEKKYGEVSKKGVAFGIGEIWGSKNADCEVKPCTDTVLLIKTGESFKEFALQGGP